jgi:hypothetical protein
MTGVAPELAAAMAETRIVREGYARLCEEFGPAWQSGQGARISLTVLNRHREAAGLPALSPRDAQGKPDMWDRQQAEIDRYRAALEAIATSDGTCGEKARKALEAQS